MENETRNLTQKLIQKVNEAVSENNPGDAVDWSLAYKYVAEGQNLIESAELFKVQVANLTGGKYEPPQNQEPSKETEDSEDTGD